MGNFISNEKNYNIINFEYILENNNSILINTLNTNNQECLIINTIPYYDEEEVINKLLKININKPIIIYGKNSSDILVFNKFNQLQNLGFKNIKIYGGGIFEWLLLQDIYGSDRFKTTKKELDILKYK
tara:strand:+ start:164 stop:547 length:384 start_codon:yes stop_codon:yes gene_type:complete